LTGGRRPRQPQRSLRDAQLCLRLFQNAHDALTRLVRERAKEAACL
jgi:hypothetical protein